MNVFETMKELTIQQKHRFNKNVPLFTVAIPIINKISVVSGFDELKRLFLQLNPNTIDIIVREFPIFSDGKIVGTEDKWCLELDGQPVFMLRNNIDMNKGQLIVALKRIGFAN
ncbi:hypothetical protein HUN92_13785 [Bacillus firmus]|uniref:hypothetical protein n=1 Tax=Cytobacillus firmus TaxID=1399 RepID=UPI00158126BA|nr:hypothetical protein [Cytobacillus firmus]NUH84791.1 hypothetical protein [Cytobacillus firmus]